MAGTNNDDRDINVRAVTKFGLGVGALLIIAIFLMWYLFDRFAARFAAHTPQPDPMVALNPRKEPPEPRLQQKPVIDLKEFRAGEDAILNSYSWVDPDKGVVRIPVERALELVAQQGLPSRKEGETQ